MYSFEPEVRLWAHVRRAHSICVLVVDARLGSRLQGALFV
jgi:hypothetical protein